MLFIQPNVADGSDKLYFSEELSCYDRMTIFVARAFGQSDQSILNYAHKQATNNNFGPLLYCEKNNICSEEHLRFISNFNIVTRKEEYRASEALWKKE